VRNLATDGAQMNTDKKNVCFICENLCPICG
jgi:hypothetical protein